MDSIVEKITADESPKMQASLAAAQARRAEGLARSERRAELIVGGGLIVVAVALPLLSSGGGSLGLGPALVATLALALFSRIRIEIGASYTAPMELAFVPMLFMVPPEFAPALVAAGLVIGKLPDLRSGKTTPGRVALSFGDAWFAVGPALVLIATGTYSAEGAAWVVLAGAFAAQIGGEFVIGSLRDALHQDEGASIRQQIQESGLVILFDAALAPIGFAIALMAEQDAAALLLAVPLALIMGVFAGERQDRLKKALELTQAYRGTAKLLGELVEHDDAYTGFHTRGVMAMSLAVAEQLELDETMIVRIESASLLHDVGKIAVPKEIINKPGPLNDEEWAIIKTHTVKGQEMLEEIGGLMTSIGAVIRSCHERFDGGGYPDGLIGEQIPVEARVIFCCDAFNAMTTTRSYREAMDVGEALQEVRDNSGTQFDPVVVAALEACVAADEERLRAEEAALAGSA